MSRGTGPAGCCIMAGSSGELLRRIRETGEWYPEAERVRGIRGPGRFAWMQVIGLGTGSGSKGHQGTGKYLDLMLQGRKGVM